jgi:hypothetical protein
LPSLSGKLKLIVFGAIVAAVVAAIAFDVWGPSVDEDAQRFADALLGKKWTVVYAFASRDEKAGLGMTADQFETFCDALADHCWATDVYPFVEEAERNPTMVANRAIGIGVAFSPKGSRRYAVTVFRKSDHASLQLVDVQFRHDRYGEWHPDVLDALMQMNRGNHVRGGDPPVNLLRALRSVRKSEMIVYPGLAKLTQSQITLYLAHKAEYWTSPADSS